LHWCYCDSLLPQLSLSGVSPLVASILNSENPAPVLVCGASGQVNAVCDRLQEDSAPNTVYRYPVTQYWPTDVHTTNQHYLYNGTSAVILTTVPMTAKVSGHCRALPSHKWHC
jgi:hypothetical protein